MTLEDGPLSDGEIFEPHAHPHLSTLSRPSHVPARAHCLSTPSLSFPSPPSHYGAPSSPHKHRRTESGHPSRTSAPPSPAPRSNPTPNISQPTHHIHSKLTFKDHRLTQPAHASPTTRVPTHGKPRPHHNSSENPTPHSSAAHRPHLEFPQSDGSPGTPKVQPSLSHPITGRSNADHSDPHVPSHITSASSHPAPTTNTSRRTQHCLQPPQPDALRPLSPKHHTARTPATSAAECTGLTQQRKRRAHDSDRHQRGFNDHHTASPRLSHSESSPLGKDCSPVRQTLENNSEHPLQPVDDDDHSAEFDFGRTPGGLRVVHATARHPHRFEFFDSDAEHDHLAPPRLPNSHRTEPGEEVRVGRRSALRPGRQVRMKHLSRDKRSAYAVTRGRPGLDFTVDEYDSERESDGSPRNKRRKQRHESNKVTNTLRDVRNKESSSRRLRRLASLADESDDSEEHSLRSGLPRKRPRHQSSSASEERKPGKLHKTRHIAMRDVKADTSPVSSPTRCPSVNQLRLERTEASMGSQREHDAVRRRRLKPWSMREKRPDREPYSSFSESDAASTRVTGVMPNRESMIRNNTRTTSSSKEWYQIDEVRKPRKLSRLDRSGHSNVDLPAKGVYWTDRERELFYIAKSNIHHKGLFTKCDIRKGVPVIEFAGEVISQAISDVREWGYRMRRLDDVYMYQLRKGTTNVIDGTKRGGPAKYVNHSCDPNVAAEETVENGINRIWFVSIRPIRHGEEILVDYRLKFEPGEEKHPCRCEARNCRKFLNYAE